MKKILGIIALLTVFALICSFAGCTKIAPSGSVVTPAEDLSEEPASDSTEVFENLQTPTGSFKIKLLGEDANYTQNGSVYTLTGAGTYTLSGALSGQIIVDAGEDDEVEIELNGASVTCDFDSPIKIVSADKAEISAKKETSNFITDSRSAKTVETESVGEGAIAATCDLKLKGSGVLIIQGGYNKGVHTTKDLVIQNLSLKVTAVNDAVKGKDSVTVKSGTEVLISTMGDGIKTEDTDLSSKGNQRGTVSIEDGTLTVFAAGDGIQASYDFNMTGGTLTVYTGSYSSYTASGASTTSYKGVKAGNELKISGGTLNIYSFDDGLHADYGTLLENGERSLGNVTISGGSVTIGVYSPAKSTAGGRMVRGGPSRWSGQQSVSGSDAIHADNTLKISGGTISVDSAYEGLEATHVLIQGGSTTVFATDDGVNAARKASNSPTIVVSGGKLDVTVPSGDTDGIDSNGTYKQTGGVVVTCGPGSASGGMGGGSFALDTDGGVTLQGGTLIVFGGIEGTPSASGMTRTLCSSSTVAAGTHTVTVGGSVYSVELKYSSSGCVVYSDGGSATLK